MLVPISLLYLKLIQHLLSPHHILNHLLVSQLLLLELHGLQPPILLILILDLGIEALGHLLVDSVLLLEGPQLLGPLFVEHLLLLSLLLAVLRLPHHEVLELLIQNLVSCCILLGGQVRLPLLDGILIVHVSSPELSIHHVLHVLLLQALLLFEHLYIALMLVLDLLDISIHLSELVSLVLEAAFLEFGHQFLILGLSLALESGNPFNHLLLDLLLGGTEAPHFGHVLGMLLVVERL